MLEAFEPCVLVGSSTLLAGPLLYTLATLRRLKRKMGAIVGVLSVRDLLHLAIGSRGAAIAGIVEKAHG